MTGPALHGLPDADEVEAWADEGKLEPRSLLARALMFGDRPLSRGLKADIEVWLAAAPIPAVEGRTPVAENPGD